MCARELGRVYRAGKLVAQGDFCDYYETDAEGVPCVLKVVAHKDDADLLDREADALRALWSSPVNGTDLFTRYLPRLVDATQTADGRAVNVLASGQGRFDEYVSLEQVCRAFPQGLSARHMVWMCNRMLELLSWLHRNGTVHGAVLPEHVMYRPHDHAGMLWNWCYATRMSKRQTLPAKVAGYEAWYPKGMLGERPPMPADDTAMLARCMFKILGGDPLTGDVPMRVFEDERGKDPVFLVDLLRLMLPTEDGLPHFPNTDELRIQFGETAQRVYGPKRFIPFTMPVAP